MNVLIEIDEKLARELERVAPARSRKRSEFIRLAIRKALMEEQERSTREAYATVPDTESEYFDPEEWTPSSRPPEGPQTRARKRR